MPSLNRHSCKPVQALLFGASTMLLVSTAAQAQAADEHFVLSAYSHAAGGQELLHGDYSAAMTKLSQQASTALASAAAVDTNLCVLLTETERWAKARLACERAVMDAHAAELEPAQASWVRQKQDDHFAMALSNRAVLEWLSADAASAAKDLDMAQKLAPQARCVASNISALSARSRVAQVTAIPQG